MGNIRSFAALQSSSEVAYLSACRRVRCLPLRSAMMRMLTVLLAAVLLLGGCASMGTPRPPAPTIEEIVQWSNEKMAAEAIIDRMKAARPGYRLPASELVE